MNHDPNQDFVEEGAPDAPEIEALRRALQSVPPASRSVLPLVQAKIRQQTRGRYFAGRRSYRDPTLLLLTAAMLILILSAAFFGLFDSLVR